MQEQASPLLSNRQKHWEPERALRLLLEELSHRVAAELTAAIGTLSSAAALAKSEDAWNALSAAQCRLENFVRVHAALRVPEFRASVDGCAYLRRLCSAIAVSRLQFRGIRLECLGRAFEIDTEPCWGLGMIVSHLVSIAGGHSFVSVPGRIWVAAARRRGLVWCQVEDNGIAEAEEADRRGIGIVDALTRDLHGGFELRRRAEGCIATVIFPAVRIWTHRRGAARPGPHVLVICELPAGGFDGLRAAKRKGLLSQTLLAAALFVLEFVAPNIAAWGESALCAGCEFGVGPGDTSHFLKWDGRLVIAAAGILNQGGYEVAVFRMATKQTPLKSGWHPPHVMAEPYRNFFRLATLATVSCGVCSSAVVRAKSRPPVL